MSMKISGAPCCWGVDDPKNPYLPPWERVLEEAHLAGFSGIELGPYGYIPLDLERVSSVLNKNHLHIIAGTIFDDLVSDDNLPNLIQQTHNICGMITRLSQPPKENGQRFKTPYLVVIDWGHDSRDYAAGHPEKAPKLSKNAWNQMISHIKQISKIADEIYGVRTVIHPHAGGFIEFADEIDQAMVDIPQEVAGLCLDTGHLYYSKMDPVEWLLKYQHRLDYVHFKDIDQKVYDEVMEEKIRFFDACAKGVMCPIGTGALPYDDIYQTLKDVGYAGFITVEQERDPRNVETSTL